MWLIGLNNKLSIVFIISQQVIFLQRFNHVTSSCSISSSLNHAKTTYNTCKWVTFSLLTTQSEN